MFSLLLALHLLAVVFAIGPLVGAATTGSRALRSGDSSAAGAVARTLRVYSYASVVVVVLGFGLMSTKHHGKTVADIGDLWIWLSLLCWIVALAVTFAVLVPAFTRAAHPVGARGADASTTEATTHEAGGGDLAALRGRAAAAGGVVGLLYALIVVLMVYRPGS